MNTLAVQRIRSRTLSTLLVGLVIVAGIGAFPPVGTSAHAYEVWALDQSDTAKESGGYLYIYDGASLAANPGSAKPTVTVDFGLDINNFCQQASGKPVRRPHMIFFTKDQSHVLISFLSGQVLFLDAVTRKPDACLSLGKNVHAAWPTPDQKMAVAANIAEKKFVRIWTDYAAHKFAFDPQKDVINLDALESGERPDTAPICPITDATSRYAFTTLRGGGLLVIDVTRTPMQIVATLNNVQVHPAGCGGIQVGETMYINSGGGWPIAPLSYDIYALDIGELPKSISARLISARDEQFSDSHGMAAVGRYVWNVDRAGNNVEIIDSLPNLSVGSVTMAGPVSEDPAPDLLDVSPDSAYVFVALRGPAPLTGNDKTVNNAKGSTPGVGVIKVTNGGRGGEFIGIARLTNMKDGKETADIHAVAVKK